MSTSRTRQELEKLLNRATQDDDAFTLYSDDAYLSDMDAYVNVMNRWPEEEIDSDVLEMISIYPAPTKKSTARTHTPTTALVKKHSLSPTGTRNTIPTRTPNHVLLMSTRTDRTNTDDYDNEIRTLSASPSKRDPEKPKQERQQPEDQKEDFNSTSEDTEQEPETESDNEWTDDEEPQANTESSGTN